MKIEYDHSLNRHTLSGPRAAIPLIFPDVKPKSLLDVGCGTGTWLKAALESGVSDVFGVDGIAIPPDQLLFPRSNFCQQDLTRPWNLGRKFEAVLCLEVAEHLDEQHAPTLINSLAGHADTIIFSAACPGQEGQHHVNCQWPAYWQGKFNECGYACTDEARWRIWADERVEPWYRQNMFTARRQPDRAGHEPRIAPVIHPANLQMMVDGPFPDYVRKLEAGRQPVTWYLKCLIKALLGKLLKKPPGK